MKTKQFWDHSGKPFSGAKADKHAEKEKEIEVLRKERDEALSDLEFRRGLYKVLEEANNRLIAANEEAVKLAQTLKQERDEAREWSRELANVCDDLRAELADSRGQLSRLYHWVERRSQDGFIDSQTHEQNITRCYDALYDRLDAAERERDEVRGALARITEAAQAVVDRWEQPSWKDTEPTAAVIYRLRDALGREAE